MADEWNWCKLGDVITLQRGYDLPKQDRQEGKVPIVTSSGITGYHNCVKVKGPGVVTGRYGTLGEVFFIKEDFWPHNTALYVRDFKGNNPLFISYFLRTLRFSAQNIAGAVPGVNRNALHMLPVLIPHLPIQLRIAAILSAYDDLIENNTRRIRILEEMAQTIYREWFVRFRFPGHKGVRMVDTELGLVPEGWDVKKLGEIAEINSENIQRDNQPEEIFYVNISSVSTGKIDLIEKMPFTEAPGRARRIVQHGDIIWSTVRPNRRSYSLIINPPENMIVSTGFAVIRARQVPFSYLYCNLTTDDFVGYLTNCATGSAYPAVNEADFDKVEILVPSKVTLDNYHQAVSRTFFLRDTLIRKNDNLHRTRDLLLPRLVSGEIDVSEIPDAQDL